MIGQCYIQYHFFVPFGKPDPDYYLKIRITKDFFKTKITVFQMDTVLWQENRRKTREYII